MKTDPHPTRDCLPGLQYVSEAFAHNWFGFAQASRCTAMDRFIEMALRQPEIPLHLETDIAAVMQQAAQFASCAPEAADSEWLTLREMITDLVAKAAGH